MPWLDSVPDSMMKPNLGINCMLNLPTEQGQLTHQSVKKKMANLLLITVCFNLVHKMQKNISSAKNWSRAIHWWRTTQQI